MKSKFIEEELKKVQFADLSNYNPETNTYLIPRYIKQTYDTGKSYLVQLNKEVLSTNTIEAANWNNGAVPPAEYLKIFVNKALGKMIYCDTLPFDPATNQDGNCPWSGWLNMEKLKLIQVL